MTHSLALRESLADSKAHGLSWEMAWRRARHAVGLLATFDPTGKDPGLVEVEGETVARFAYRMFRSAYLDERASRLKLTPLGSDDGGVDARPRKAA